MISSQFPAAPAGYDAPGQEPLEVDRVYSQMSQHKRDDLQDVFSFLDVHGEGTMLIEQLGLGLRASGIRISDVEITALVSGSNPKLLFNLLVTRKLLSSRLCAAKKN
jgi:Ca2+-binding EF-hand superfamily protein